jgi:stage II sporulation protein AA (anti-sigma F factor antagonist)
MEIQTRKERNAVLVSVRGRIDAMTAPEFEKTLSDLISKGEINFLLNFSMLEYIRVPVLETFWPLQRS